MRKSFFLIWAITVFAITIAFCGKGILDRIGNWKVEVGPAGNEFYQPPIPPSEATPPSQNLFKLVKEIAPAYTKVKRWELLKDNLYFIRAESGPEEYDFQLTSDGKIQELEYENDSTNVEEEADALVLQGTKKKIKIADAPESTVKTIARVTKNQSPTEAWIATTIAGTRYVLAVGETVFYATPDGQIQAIGLIANGALNEIDPPSPKKSHDEILTEATELLGPFRDRFNLETQIKNLGNRPKRADGRFRFVVIGDSRSNQDLWTNIVKHIDQLDPKPEFVINVGDIVRHGYVKEYHEYYIPPLLKTEIPFFIAIGNHDDGEDAMAVEYRYLFGDNVLNYYFDYGNIRFVLFDNVTSVNPYKETLNWLEKVLTETPKDTRIIVAAHKPVTTIEKWAYHAWDKDNSKIFTQLMTKYKDKVDHVFFGHIHAYSTATFNGVDYTVCGGGGAGLHNRYGPQGNVHHYVICDVQPDGTMKQQVVRFYKIK